MLEVSNATFGYVRKNVKKTVLEDVSFSLKEGELLCVLGANGVGKTTMYRTILGFLPLLEGSLKVEGSDITAMTRERLAKYIAYVPQYHTPPFAYSVKDVVLMGRGAHISRFSSPSAEDEGIALEMMERMGVCDLKDEIYTEISGGERQLVLIARALTQQTKYILMDEPAANLDFGNQLKLIREIKKLAREGIGVCFTTHYPEHAFLSEATVLALEGKRSYTFGPAEEVITGNLLRRMYGINAEILTHRGKGGRINRHIVTELDQET